MEKLVQKVYILMLVVVFVIMCYAFGHGQSNNRNGMEIEQQKIDPVSMRQIDDMTVEYVFDVSGLNVEFPCLEFYTNHQFVSVFADGKEIYSLGEVQSVYGNSPGSILNYVDFPDEAKELVVTIRAVYPEVQGREYDFLIGYGLKDYKDAVLGGLFSEIICLFIILLGVALVIYWAIFHLKVNDGPSVLYFGVTAQLIGLWCLNETDLTMLVAANHTIASFVSYVLLMLLPIPIVNFYRRFLQIADVKLCLIVDIASVANFVICIILHVTGVLYFKQTILFTHIVLAVAMLYVLYTIVTYALQYGFDRFIRINIAALFVIAFSFSFDIVSYYIGFQQTDVLGKLGIMVYIVLMAFISLQNFSKQIEEGKKIEIYREMAVRDGLTGLYNRAAYEDWEQSTRDFTDTMIIMLDLNDLKKCNDTYGHLEGDKYLMNAANIINLNYSELGKCYRLGGDEFCVIVPNSNTVRIENFIRRMERKEEELNKTIKTQKIAISYGFAIYEESDQSFLDTYQRADEAMYAKKQQMKRS